MVGWMGQRTPGRLAGKGGLPSPVDDDKYREKREKLSFGAWSGLSLLLKVVISGPEAVVGRWRARVSFVVLMEASNTKSRADRAGCNGGV